MKKYMEDMWDIGFRIVLGVVALGQAFVLVGGWIILLMAMFNL
jgi:hypothetical protein